MDLVPIGSGSYNQHLPTYYLGMGMKTGVDLAKVVEAGNFISSALNRYYLQFSAKDVLGQFKFIF
jgi:hypothetical protein